MISTATRSRSYSAGDKLVARHQRHDGVNPYAPKPISDKYNQMIEEGRERAIRLFENPCGGENVKHDVVHISVLAQGDAELDKFRIVSQSPNGFSAQEEQRIQSFAGAPCERGANTRTVFVHVLHASYDRRALGFELSPGDWLILVAGLLSCTAALYFAYLCNLNI